MTEPSRPTVAIIGCGSIATAHAYGFIESDAGRLVGLADLRREAVDELGDASGVPAAGRFEDYRAMLEAVHPDIAVICLWHGQHAEAVLAAADRGVRLVLCEKPMATSLGQAEQMMVATQRVGAKLAIAHQRRFYPGWTEARRLLAEGAIGRPTHARLDVRDGLLNSGTHSVDLVRYVLGDPDAVSVTAAVQRDTDRYERGQRTEDSALAMIELAGGVRVFIESDIARTGLISANAVITGTEGLMAIEENHVRVMHAGTSGWETVAGEAFGTDGGDPLPESALAQPMYRLIAHFGTAVIGPFMQNFVDQARTLVEWMDGRVADHPGAARHGYAALEILMAIYESARCHEITRLPLATRVHPLDLMVESGALPVTRPGRYDIRSGLVRGESMSWS